MTQLLVSVRNPEEALLACSSGVEIIDLKDPAAGALGAVAPTARNEIAQRLRAFALDRDMPLLSVALGELCQYLERVEEAAELSQLQAFRFAKVGLAGAQSLRDWKSAWLTLVQSLPPGTIPVAAAYADATAARAPEPEDVLELALEQSLPVYLLDTWSKSRGNVFEVLSEKRLERLREQASGRIKFALAGSLDLDCAPYLRNLRPEIVAVRGAVCVAGRNSPMSGARISLWKTLVSQLADSTSLGPK